MASFPLLFLLQVRLLLTSPSSGTWTPLFLPLAHPSSPFRMNLQQWHSPNFFLNGSLFSPPGAWPRNWFISLTGRPSLARRPRHLQHPGRCLTLFPSLLLLFSFPRFLHLLLFLSSSWKHSLNSLELARTRSNPSEFARSRSNSLVLALICCNSLLFVQTRTNLFILTPTRLISL